MLSSAIGQATRSFKLGELVDPIVLAARYRYSQALRRNIDCHQHQLQGLFSCLERAEETQFGRDHHFAEIESYEDFKEAVPLRTHQQLSAYIDAVLEGRPDVLWPGHPKYLLFTGGTTSVRSQMIPATAEGLRRTQLGTIHSALFQIADSGSSRLTRGKQVILGAAWQGAHHACGAEVTKISGAGPGSLPDFLQRRMVIPSREVANEADFDRKLDLIVGQALRSEVAQISSMPVWLISFFERVGEAVGLGADETLRSVWKDLTMVLYTGASIAPYRHIFERWLGEEIALWEQYSATEGMIATKESRRREDLLVLADNGSFFEFVPVEDFGKDIPRRYGLWQVETDREYVIVLTNPNGLFGYMLGDTVRFTSLRPYRLVVSGRASLCLNTMGEHVGSEAIERSMCELQRDLGLGLVEFTVGPGRAERGSSLHHEWIVECTCPPVDLSEIEDRLDGALRRHASDYSWLRSGRAMGAPSVTIVPRGTFARWVREHRGDDPQVKVPKVRNDRQLIDQVLELARPEAAT